MLVDGFANIGPYLRTRSSPDSVAGSELAWFCDPTAWRSSSSAECKGVEGDGGHWCVDGKGCLVLGAPSKKDFWRKTFYSPVLCKDDGPCLFATLPNSQPVMMETTFTLDYKRQFDQAGLCLRLGPEHWIKTGIEVVDGKPRLSCVVTNVYSDWSTQPWPSGSLRIRMHVLGESVVIEASPWSSVATDASNEEDWQFIRIAHLSPQTRQAHDALAGTTHTWPDPSAASPPQGYAWMGVFACCPEQQDGCTATFHSFSIRTGTNFKHNADGNH